MSSDLNLFFALSASAVTIFLGILVFIHDRKSATNLIFFAHSIVGAIWSIVNYFSIVSTTDQIIWIRFVLFLAVPHVFLFLLFIQNFPSEKLVRPRQFYSSLVLMFAMMILVTTRYVFESVTIIDGNAVPIVGILIPVFSGTLVLFFVTSVVLVIRKFFQSKGLIKRQWFSIGGGLLVSYILLICLVFLRVIIFNNTFFVPYSPLFLLFIFIGAAYAILRHQLFNVKIIATEILIFILLLASFIQVIISESTLTLGLGIAVIIFILIAGTLLIRSVLKEVEQRQQLQVLTEKLAAANEQLKILDQARSEFITIASHQLRTPPATIKWYLASILDGDYGNMDATVKEQLRKTMSTNNSMISLIDDLLNVSRIERGKMEFIFQPTDLNEITQVTVDQLLPQSKMKKLELVYQKPAQALPVITADKEKLRQVINNLIDNAIKYTQKGKILVEVGQTKKDLFFKVTDSGRGVAPNQLAHIFEKFDRGKSPVRNSVGLGLGLYVAKVIIEYHKGKIWVESTGEGKGSTFNFTVPIKANLDNTVFDLTKTQKPA